MLLFIVDSQLIAWEEITSRIIHCIQLYVEYSHTTSLAHPYGSFIWWQIRCDMKDEQFYISLQTYLWLFYQYLESTWLWDCLVSGIWNCMFSWIGDGGTCCIYTWIFNWRVAWLGTWKFLWYVVIIFGWSFTWITGWIYYWRCRQVFGWVITGASTWKPNRIYKYRSYDSWHASGSAFWFVVWLQSGHVLVFLSPPPRLQKI